MARQLKVGLCGLGFMGSTHLGAYASLAGVEVVAVCHASPKRFAKLTAGNIQTSSQGEALLKRVQRYGTLDDMLEHENLDIVDICTPTNTHADLAVAALRSGRHVLCEKPMALTLADCDRMIRAARRARRHLMVAHCLRWWPDYELLHDLVRSGRHGRLAALHLFRGTQAPAWAGWMADEKKSGGPQLDLHIHDIDQALWLLGRPTTIAVAMSADRRVGTAVYRYPRAMATVAYNGNLGGGMVFNMSYVAHFERATVEFDHARQPALSLWANGRLSHPLRKATDAYQAEIRYFVNCVRGGQAPARVTPAEARAAVALALRERAAARARGWVPREG